MENNLNLQIVSSYIEDDLLHVLVSTKISSGVEQSAPEPRWTIIADPETRGIVRVDFCIATDEGFEYPEYTPTNEQMALFRKFVKECQ